MTGRERSSAAKSFPVVGACDLGTYSGLILIAQPSQSGWEVLAEEQHVIDLLGDGLPGGRVPSSAILRAEALVRRFDYLASLHGCDTASIVSTAAVRQAVNRAEIVKRLRAVTRHRVSVLTARGEGLLTVRGALIGLPDAVQPSIIIDIGGGSTEAVRETAGGWQFRGVRWGAARATEAWQGQRPKVADHRYDYYLSAAHDLMSDLPTWKRAEGYRLVAVGGSAVTLAAMHSRHKRLNPDKLHGCELTTHWLITVARRLSTMDTDEIARLIPFDPKRSRVITAGTFLWAAVCKRFDAERITVSARGLRWGVADQLAKSERP